MVLAGGEVAARPWHIFLICDYSDSMAKDGKIQKMNDTIKGLLPSLRAEADKNPNYQIYLRSLKFSDGAEWIDDHPIMLNDFVWHDLPAGGRSDLGSALKLVAYELRQSRMSRRVHHPTLILFSGSTPTDDWQKGLILLKSQRWGREADRIAVSFSSDTDIDVLQIFTGKDPREFKVLEGANPTSIIKNIKFYEDARPLSAFTQPPSPVLPIILICDCSESMKDKAKIKSVNSAVKEFITFIQKMQSYGKFSSCFSIMTFSDGAQWVIDNDGSTANFLWKDLEAKGKRELGSAFHLLALKMKSVNFPDSSYAPVIILFTDGAPSTDYQSGLYAMWMECGGTMSNRFAIGIGKDTPLSILKEFTDDESRVYHVSNEIQLSMALGQISTRLCFLLNEKIPDRW